jgi:uncharacterized membrane protein (UPF0127 family)
MDKNTLLGLCAFVAVALFLFWVRESAILAPASESLPQACITEKGCWSIELASTPAAREKGLMDRPALAAGHGMWFVFEQAAPRTFWMKNVAFPLDLVWINGKKKIVGISKNVPPCAADPCPTYPSPAPAQFVLEINANESDAFGLVEGDVVSVQGTP